MIHGHQKRMKIGVKKPTKGGLRSSKSGRSDSAKYGRDEDHAEGDSSRPDMDGDNRPSLADKDASERPHVPDSGPDVAGHSLEIDLTPDLKQQPQSSKSDEKKSGHPAPKPRKKGDEDRASSLAAIRAIKEAIEIDIPWTAKHYRIIRKYHLPNLTIEQIKDAVLDAEDAIRRKPTTKPTTSSAIHNEGRKVSSETMNRRSEPPRTGRTMSLGNAAGVASPIGHVVPKFSVPETSDCGLCHGTGTLVSGKHPTGEPCPGCRQSANRAFREAQPTSAGDSKPLLGLDDGELAD